MPCQGASAAQQLPKHLRRRAVSHNVNRLPRRLRPRHNAERAKSDNIPGNGIQKKPKRPTRKFRRRPSNLLLEYERRQKGEKGGKWLESHIWHAKRFHMVNTASESSSNIEVSNSKTCPMAHLSGRWGYKLAEYSNDKIFRSCYRGISQKCLLHDMSYLGCIEITGRECDLEECLTYVTPLRQHSFFSSEEVMRGSKEGSAWIYSPEVFPRGVIGNVSFMWHPSQPAIKNDSKTCLQTLWIWCHPSFYDEIWNVFQELLGLTIDTEQNEKSTQSSAEFKDFNNEKKMSCRNVPHNKMPRYISSKYPNSVTVIQLRDTLNRYRLMGPTSQKILCDTFKETKIDYLKGESASTNQISNNNKSWWLSYHDKEAVEIGDKQWDYINSVLSSKQPGHVSPKTILGLTVRDPRKLLPRNKQCAQISNSVLNENQNNSNEPGRLAHLANSPIWNANIRDEVTLTKVPDHCINEMRSKLLTPGVSILPLDEEEARIPVLLIHQPGEIEGTFGDGWDVIIPAGWGMPFWMNFIYRGAKAVGQKELLNNMLEMKKFPPLKNAPDSSAGMYEMMREAELLRIVHFSHPPDKRPNFAKLGSVSPFLQPWNVLINNWSKHIENVSEIFDKNDSSFYVIRDGLRLNQMALKMKNSSNGQHETKAFTEFDHYALIPVMLEIVGKGTLGPNTVISWPLENDLFSLIDYKAHGMNKIQKNKLRPCEPLVNSDAKEIRKQLKLEHFSEQKNLRRKCQSLKKKIITVRASMDINDSMTTEKCKQIQDIKEFSNTLNALKKIRKEKISLYNSKMSSAWGIDYTDIKNVKELGSRPTIGYVNFGGQSLRYGSKGIGLGYVSLSGFLQLLQYYATKHKDLEKLKSVTKHKGVIVMLRSPDSVHYSYGLMTIYTKLI